MRRPYRCVVRNKRCTKNNCRHSRTPDTGTGGEVSSPGGAPWTAPWIPHRRSTSPKPVSPQQKQGSSAHKRAGDRAQADVLRQGDDAEGAHLSVTPALYLPKEHESREPPNEAGPVRPLNMPEPLCVTLGKDRKPGTHEK